MSPTSSQISAIRPTMSPVGMSTAMRPDICAVPAQLAPQRPTAAGNPLTVKTLSEAEPQLLPDHPVDDDEEFLLASRGDRRPRGAVMSTAFAADGLGGGAHDGRQVEALRDELPRAPRADLDPVLRVRESDDREVFVHARGSVRHSGGDAHDGVADLVGAVEVLDRRHLLDPDLVDEVEEVDERLPVPSKEREGLLKGFPSVAPAHAMADVGPVVSAARVDERPVLLRIAERAPLLLLEERVHLADQPLRLLRPDAAVEHVADELRHDEPLLARRQLAPRNPSVVLFRLEPELEEERDARLAVPGEPRDPGVVRVLQHLVDGTRLPPEEAEVRVGVEHPRFDPVLQDLAVESPHAAVPALPRGHDPGRGLQRRP